MSNNHPAPKVGAPPQVVNGLSGRWISALQFNTPTMHTYCTVEHIKSITGSHALAELLRKAPSIEFHGHTYHSTAWLVSHIITSLHTKKDKKMNELIPVTMNNEGIPTVSGRILHQFLEVETRYNDWFSRMCEYGFTENVDFISFTQNGVKPQGGRPETDHAITLDMAKELSMIQRTPKGKEARQYFIDVEKAWNSPERIMERALLIAQTNINKLKLESKVKDERIKELTPKADYYDLILSSKSLMCTTVIAKDYGMSTQEFNVMLHKFTVQYKQGDTWFLYSKYQDQGYVHSTTVPITHSDGRVSLKITTKWTQKGRIFLYEFLKSKGIVPIIERDLQYEEAAI